MSTATTHIKTEKQLVPELRFKEFVGDWKVSKLGDYCTFSQGIQVDVELQSREPKEGYIKFLRIENYTQKSQDFRYIPLDVAGKKRIKADEIAVVRYGATAGFISKGFNGVLANNLFKVIPDEERFTLPFIFEHLNSHRAFSFFQAEMSGGAMPALSFGIVKALKVPVTSIPEQQKIASFLSAVDEKIQQLTKKKALLEDYKKGVMQQLFPSTGSGQGSRQLRFKDANGKAYPDWEEKRLGEVADRVANKNTANEINYVLTNSAKRGIVSQLDYFDKDIANQNNLEGYYIVDVDDFVYNPRVSVHAPVGPIKRNKLKEGVMSPLYSVFRFKEKNLEYFEYYFETVNWHRYLVSVANIGARHDRMNIINSDFFKMPIPFPCDDERRAITNFLNNISLKIESSKRELTQTQTFKKGLLQQMFV